MILFAAESSVAVNRDADIQKKQTKANTLSFSVLAPGAPAPAGGIFPSIRVYLPCGDDEDGEHFLTGSGDANAIEFTLASGWRAGRWESVSDGLTCLLTYRPEKVEPLSVVSFAMTNIVSYAGKGIAEIAFLLKNFPAAPAEVFTSVLVRKEEAPLEILHFTPDRPGITAGEKAALSWRTSGADAGAIVPGEFRLFDKGARFEHRPAAPEDFTLTVHTLRESAQTTAGVTMMPPHCESFAYSAADKTLRWTSAHATGVLLDGASVPPAGSAPAKAGQTASTLALSGYAYDLDCELHYNAHPELLFLRRETWWFHNAFAVVRVAWKFSGAAPAALHISTPGRTDAQRVERGAEGTWEFPYPGAIPEMTLRRNDFSLALPERKPPRA